MSTEYSDRLFVCVHYSVTQTMESEYWTLKLVLIMLITRHDTCSKSCTIIGYRPIITSLPPYYRPVVTSLPPHRIEYTSYGSSTGVKRRRNFRYNSILFGLSILRSCHMRNLPFSENGHRGAAVRTWQEMFSKLEFEAHFIRGIRTL